MDGSLHVPCGNVSGQQIFRRMFVHILSTKSPVSLSGLYDSAYILMKYVRMWRSTLHNETVFVFHELYGRVDANDSAAQIWPDIFRTSVVLYRFSQHFHPSFLKTFVARRCHWWNFRDLGIIIRYRNPDLM